MSFRFPAVSVRVKSSRDKLAHAETVCAVLLLFIDLCLGRFQVRASRDIGRKPVINAKVRLLENLGPYYNSQGHHGFSKTISKVKKVVSIN